MWDTLFKCLEGLFRPSAQPPAEPVHKRMRLWVRIKCTDFLIANGTSMEEDVRGRHEYLRTVGVNSGDWTYSVETPSRETPEGWRWVSLEESGGYCVRVRL
jgi:hypothetical protein